MQLKHSGETSPGARDQASGADFGTNHRTLNSATARSNDLGTSHIKLDSSTGADLDTSHHTCEGASKMGEEPQDELEGGAEILLEGAEFKNYQQQSARANYLCLDRPDIGYATKELMRRMSAPTGEDYAALKKLG